MPAALAPLRLGAFRRLALVRFVDELGDWLGEIALAVLVFDRTGSPMATAVLFLALQFAPAIATPPLVARLEGLHTRLSLTGLNALQAAVFAALAAVSTDFSLVVVIALAMVAGSLAVSGRTLTRAAAAAMLSPRGMLREGNALLNIGFTAGAALGPPLAGLLAAQAAAFVFFAVVIPIEVVFAKETLGSGDAGYGALLASWGAGMLGGGVVFAALPRTSLRTLLGVSTLAVGFAYLATAASPTLLVACVASSIGGAGNGVQWVGLMTAVQQLAPAGYQARVISLLEALAKAMPGVGFLLGGALAAIFNPRVSYAVAGAGVMAVLVTAAVVLSRAGWGAMEAPGFDVATEARLGGSRAAEAPGSALPETPERGTQ